MAAKEMKAKDRVRRVNGTGCAGTLIEIRTEVTASTTEGKDRDKPLLVSVLWDNGTYSYFAPEGLEVIG